MMIYRAVYLAQELGEITEEFFHLSDTQAIEYLLSCNEWSAHLARRTVAHNWYKLIYSVETAEPSPGLLNVAKFDTSRSAVANYICEQLKVPNGMVCVYTGKGKEITVVDDTAEEEEKEDKKKKTKKDSAAAPSSKGKDKGKSDKEEKKKRKTSGGGVIATIIEILKTTSAKKPLSKDEIVQRLAKKFPDREESSMASTVLTQCGGKLKKYKDVDVKKNEKGYYL
jgi:hypothetical protein